VGDDAFLVPEAPTTWSGKTFSRLALPAEGALSLGVGLGKLRSNPTSHTIHPPSEEIPGAVVGVPTFLDRNRAEAILFNYLDPIPRAPLDDGEVVHVRVDVSVGDSSRPCYLVSKPQAPPALVQAFGSAHLIVYSSTTDVARAHVQFLEHNEGPSGPFEVTMMRNFSISRQLALAPGTRWVYVGLEIRMSVQRLFIPTAPPLTERAGFAMIDLR
jgi:hypothetical protein